MNKPDLLAAIYRDRIALDTRVGALTEPQLTSSSVDGAWRIQDHLAHIAAWERMLVGHLTDGSDAAIAGMDAESYATATLDELNGRLYQLWRDRALSDVLREYADAYQALVAFLDALPEERLTAPYWADDPQRRTVLEKVSGDTFLHYGEHATWIDETVARTAEVG